MPPRQRMNKDPPKIKSNSTQTTSSEASTYPQTASGLSQKAEDQFELELCWCIQQLQTILTKEKLQEKQAYDITRNLNALKSNSASLIKKRQIMRNTFGNYREKMAQEEQKLDRQTSSVKFMTLPAINKKSVFLKKARGHPHSEEDTQNTGSSFRFNFQTVE